MINGLIVAGIDVNTSEVKAERTRFCENALIYTRCNAMVSTLYRIVSSYDIVNFYDVTIFYIVRFYYIVKFYYIGNFHNRKILLYRKILRSLKFRLSL